MNLEPIPLALDLSFVLLTLSALLTGLRLVRGPEPCDRVLALDTLYVNVVALVLLLGMRQGSALMFEAALIVAMLGFVSTVALARYLTRGDVIE